MPTSYETRIIFAGTRTALQLQLQVPKPVNDVFCTPDPGRVGGCQSLPVCPCLYLSRAHRHIHAYAHVHACTHTYACTYTHVQARTYTRVHVSTFSPKTSPYLRLNGGMCSPGNQKRHKPSQGHSAPAFVE